MQSFKHHLLTISVVNLSLFLSWPLLPLNVTKVHDTGSQLVQRQLLFLGEAQDVQGILSKYYKRKRISTLGAK